MSEDRPDFKDYGLSAGSPSDAPGHAHRDSISSTSKDDRLWGMLVHMSSVAGHALGVMTWIPPLIIWLVKKDESRFVEHQGREALNFQLTMLLGYLLSIPLLFVAVGFLTMIAIAVCSLVYSIIAGLKANEGVWYTYPFSIKFVGRSTPPAA